MPRLSNDQRVWICVEMARVNNAAEVLRRWPARWPNVHPPVRKTIMQTYRKFRD